MVQKFAGEKRNIHQDENVIIKISFFLPTFHFDGCLQCYDIYVLVPFSVSTAIGNCRNWYLDFKYCNQ